MKDLMKKKVTLMTVVLALLLVSTETEYPAGEIIVQDDFNDFEVVVEADENFKRILSIKVDDYRVISKQPLTVDARLTIKNKSLWWIDVNGKIGTTKTNIFKILKLPPEWEKEIRIKLQKDESIQISFNGREGESYLINLVNTLYVGLFGTDCYNIGEVMQALLLEFGDKLLEKLEKNPYEILKFLANRNLYPKQTRLDDWMNLQDFFGKLKGALSIVGVLTSAPGQIRGLDEWFIIMKDQIGYLTLKLLYIYGVGNWDIQTVDPESMLVGGISITLDSKKNPHICYKDGKDLKYARWAKGRWNIQTIDSGPHGFGEICPFKLDSKDNPHIFYYSPALLRNELKYARWTGNTWEIQTVVDFGEDIEDIKKQGYTGVVAVAIDSNNNPHIVYYASSKGIRYARWTDNSWNVQTIDSNIRPPRSYSREEGICIRLDNKNNLHIFYWNRDCDELRYARCIEGKWDIRTVDLKRDRISGKVSIVLDSNDKPHISYYDWNDKELKYARWTGSKWDIQTVGPKVNLGLSPPSIALDNNDNPHISYPDSDKELKYARWTGSTWEIQTVDSERFVGECPSIVLDGNNKAHIAYAYLDDIIKTKRGVGIGACIRLKYAKSQ